MANEVEVNTLLEETLLDRAMDPIKWRERRKNALQMTTISSFIVSSITNAFFECVGDRIGLLLLLC